jgi:molybdate transport system substrate-binding protein
VLSRAIAVALAAALLAAHQGPEPAQITVSAAVSLTDVLTAIADDYGRRALGSIRFNFGASNVLARQIANGAPADVFISADDAQMDVVAAAKLIRPGSRVPLLRNQLAVVVPNDRPRTLRSIRDLTDPTFKRIAIGDPAAVPAGVYAKQYLEAQGLWQAIEPRVVPAGSVRAALTAVETGAADAGIVYRTDARLALHATVAWVVPAADGPRIVYPGAIIATSGHPQDAQKFLDFLRGETGARIFERFGFTTVR